MLTREFTYTDFDGIERTDICQFNLTKSELIQMELGKEGRMTNMLDRIVKAKNVPSLMQEFKDFILLTYGQKSDDGRRFVKSKELSEAFSQTVPYDMLFMELITDDNKAAEFINGLIPKDLQEKIASDPEYQQIAAKYTNGTANSSPVVSQVPGTSESSAPAGLPG